MKTRRLPFSRGEKQMLWGATFGCGLALSGGLLVARMKTEPQWNIPKVSIPRDNGYDVYAQAAQTIRWSKPNPDPVDDSPYPTLTPAQKRGRYSLARREAWLQSNAAGFALFEDAKKLESRYPTPYAELMPTLSRMRTLARFKIAQSNTLAMQKQWFKAANAALDDVELGFDVARGGPLVARLTGAAVTAIGLQPLESPTLVENLSAAQARAAMQRLERLMAGRPTFADALETERWYGVANWKRVMKDPRWRDKMFGPRCMMGVNAPPPNALDKAATKAGNAAIGFGLGVTAPNPTILANHHRVFDWVALNFPKPYGAALDPDPEGLDITSRILLSNLLRDSLDTYRFGEAREQNKLRLVLLQLALQAHRQQHGVFPASLSELTPILKTVPLDPFASKAFGYRRAGNTYELWSVGPDGRDDGGKSIAGTKSSLDGLTSVRRERQGDWVAGRNR